MRGVCVCYMTGVLCPVLVPGNFTKFDESRRGYGAQVTVTCQTGYWFSHGVAIKQLTCQDDSTWSAAMADCTGKYTRP